MIVRVSPSNATTTLLQYTRRILAHPRLQTLERSRLQVQSCQTMHVRSDQSKLALCHNMHLRHSPGALTLSHLGSGEPPHSGMTCRRQKVQGLQLNGVGNHVIVSIGILPPNRLAWRYFPVTSENVGWSGSRSASSFEVSSRAVQSDRGQSIWSSRIRIHTAIFSEQSSEI